MYSIASLILCLRVPSSLAAIVVDDMSRAYFLMFSVLDPNISAGALLKIVGSHQ